MGTIGRPFPEILREHASQLARIALENIQRLYPNYPAHVVCKAGDLLSHQTLHPVFYGSYDWHSSVHMHWLLVRLLSLHPEIPEADQIHHVFDRHFTSANVAVEAAYFNEPANRSFERTYGWAWLLKLHAEMNAVMGEHQDMARWKTHLQPLADTIIGHYLDFLPLAQFPIRTGTHGNSAFGLLLAFEYARTMLTDVLKIRIASKAIEWFGNDKSYPANYEPGGDDFLSAGLMEAALMQRVLDQQGFKAWWQSFCPDRKSIEAWFFPVHVSDRSDPKLAHLDGLNLSRAWCWQLLLPSMPDRLVPDIHAAISAHLTASLPHAFQGDYAGTHWLASFALLALSTT
jgi:hypothetical protein